jgi:alkanesulfonate monooxygenase SsuD/methylene tetrahydromethanopterin reductase-like flavin-dependent oxidoreductase (luciferase family)
VISTREAATSTTPWTSCTGSGAASSSTSSPTRVCPTPVHDRRVPILVGGTSDRTVRRVIDWAAGLTVGGAAAEQAAPLIEQVRTAWSEAGRQAQPRVARSPTSRSAAMPRTTRAATCVTTTASSASSPT